MSPRYSIDSVVVRGRRLFGWGFCLDVAGPLRRCLLEVPLVEGGTALLDVLPGGYREDLVHAFPGQPHAGGSGFMINGRAPQPIGSGTATLRVTTADGLEHLLTLPDFPGAYMPATEVPLASGLSRVREIARSRGYPAAAFSSVGGVLRRIRTFWASWSHRTKRPLRAPALVIDHAMGGGANRYRDERIQVLRDAGHDVLLVVPELATLSYRATAFFAGESKGVERRFDAQDELLQHLGMLRFDHVEVNNLVGFDDPPSMLAAIRSWRETKGGRLRFLLHDFHAICPSFTLIGWWGAHCGVPDLDTCRACLPRNARQTLGLHNDQDPVAWRDAWAGMLRVADEIVAFSEASKSLLLRGQPDVAPERVLVEGHRLDATGLRPVKPRWESPVCVAAVGHLNHAKGADLMRQLAARASVRGLPLRFLVVGTLDGGTQGVASLRVTGGFSRDGLCDLLESEGVGIAIVPSICPETYSYVTDEIMAMDLPIAVLDLGAPPERVGRYHRGIVLPREGLDAQLDALVGFATRSGRADQPPSSSERIHG